MICYIGIDPGASGGLVCLSGAGGVRSFIGMPDTVADLVETLQAWSTGCTVVAYMESVHSSPQMGVSSAFKFGRNVGVIEGVLAALKIRHEFVSPQKWQKAMGLLSKGRALGRGDSAKKKANKAAAQSLFPGLKITHAIADALLIGEYGRRIEVRDSAARRA